MGLFTQEKYQKCWDKAIALLSRREYAEVEIIRKLQDKRFSEEDINSTLNKLKKEQLINDEEFANRFVQNSIQFKKDGYFKVRQKLILKGVKERLINKAWTMFGEKFEKDLAEKAAEKKLVTLKNESSQKIREKLMRFLSSRGFSIDIIKNIIEKIM